MSGEAPSPVVSDSRLRGRIGLVAYRRTADDVDAIDEHSRRLVEALCKRGDPASYTSVGLPRARGVDPRVAWILVQYNPWSYGRWGVAPGLLRDAVAIRRRLAAPMALMVHEGWLETSDIKSGLIGGYQRLQLRSLSRVATVLMATTEVVARELGPHGIHVPVASNITPIAASSETARRKLGLGDEFVVAIFGRDNPSRALDHAEAAIDAIACAVGPEQIRVFNLGAGAPALRAPPAVGVSTPGRMSAEELSLQLRASDLMLLPFTDGLSTRRTTLMAALAHGLPVLGLCGRATDDVLVQHGDIITMTPVGDVAAYRRAAVDLAMDRCRRRTGGESGRRLYHEQFDWPHVARRVMSAIEKASAPARQRRGHCGA